MSALGRLRALTHPRCEGSDLGKRRPLTSHPGYDSVSFGPLTCRNVSARW